MEFISHRSGKQEVQERDRQTSCLVKAISRFLFSGIWEGPTIFLGSILNVSNSSLVGFAFMMQSTCKKFSSSFYHFRN